MLNEQIDVSSRSHDSTKVRNDKQKVSIKLNLRKIDKHSFQKNKQNVKSIKNLKLGADNPSSVYDNLKQNLVYARKFNQNCKFENL